MSEIDPPIDHPQITQFSPIAAALVGGIEILIEGVGFQIGAEVYFGNLPAPEVTLDDNKNLRVTLPQVTEPGAVEVAVVHPDGSMATAETRFTYVTTEPSEHAEVLSVEPGNVIEDVETDVIVRGYNLVFAYEKGAVLLRGPNKVTISVLDVTHSHDESSGIEELNFRLRVTSTPSLGPQERLVIQVLASMRAEALIDGVFESSRQMFIVLPNAVPVALAYTSNIDPSKPNLVVVAGRNLEGCSFDLGGSVSIKMQHSDDGLLAGIAFLPEGSSNFESIQISILDPQGGEVARYDMSVGPGDPAKMGSPPPNELLNGDPDPSPIDIGLSLTQAPGQEPVGPTIRDSKAFDLSGQPLSSLNFDTSNFSVSTETVRFGIPIINFVRLIPFFDGGGDNTDIQAQVGKLFPVRGAGLLLALRIEISITFEVIIVFGFNNDIWDHGLINEFPQFHWGIGSFVIGLVIIIQIEVFVHFLIALVLPTGQLQVIELFELTIGLDFTITNNGLHLNFDPRFRHRVIFRGIFPFNNLLPCDGRFQLADENGQTVFPDGFGRHRSFYFARQAGQCCAPWTFDLDLVRFTTTGPEVPVQGPFTTNICTTAAQSPGLANIIITSEHPAPSGFPPRLTMTFDDRAALKCMAQPVDAGGNPTGVLQDVTTLGYNVEFFLEPFLPDVLDPTLVGSGDASPVLAGDNVIHARIWRRPSEIQFFTFWPGGVLGFSINGQLSRGLPPAVIGGTLPVTVHNPTQIVAIPTLVFRHPQNPNVPTESPALFNNQQDLVREIERYEPFEYASNQSQQLDYVVAVKLSFPTNYSFPTTLTFKITTVDMMVLGDRTGTPISLAPLTGTGISGNRATDNNAAHFFDKLVLQGQEVTIELPSRPAANSPIELKTSATVGFIIAPNIRDEPGLNNWVPPGRLVTGRDVMLLIKLEETSPAVVAEIKKLKLAVRNDETYEEYLRVLPEVGTILTGSAFENFARDFMAALPTTGAPTATFLDTKGKDLWNLAVTTALTTKDDRPLYWARLLSIGALRAHFKRKGLGQPTVSQFEWPSRGLEQIDGRINFGTTLPTARKAIVTGFDPFQLPSQPDRSNPSGLLALSVNNKTIASANGNVVIKTAIFPVRYKDFDLDIVENAVGPHLGAIVLLITCSQGRGFYDVERFAGKMRANQLLDNNRVFMPSLPNSPLLTDPVGSTVGGDQVLESTLPYERVIKASITTRLLPGPQPTPPPPFANDTGFIVNQYYWVLGAPETPDPGNYRAQPTNANNNDPTFDATYLKKEKPRAGSTLREASGGAGGNYLSNEVFYRTALKRVRTRPSLPSGHLHVPPLGAQGNQPNLSPGLINAVETALLRFLNDTLRLRSLGDLTFPDTSVNMTSGPRSLQAQNETTAIVGVNSVQIDPPQGFAIMTSVPTNVSPNSVLSLVFTFTPTQVREYVSIVRVLDAAGEILFSAQLTGKGLLLPPTPVISSFNPLAAPLGDSVVIFGANLGGATSVRLGTLEAPFSVVDDTLIIAEVIGPPRLVPITVVTPSGSVTSSGSFRVVFIRPQP